MEGFSVSEEIRRPIWQEQGLWKPWREMMKLRRQRLRNKWVGRKWKRLFHATPEKGEEGVWGEGRTLGLLVKKAC